VDSVRVITNLDNVDNSNFVVSTYNVLLDGFEGDLMNYVDDKSYLNWSVRHPIICKSLRKLNSDVLMLNEVNEVMVKKIVSELEIKNYTIGKLGRSCGRPMECAIVWNSNKFVLEKTIEPLAYKQRCLMVLLRHIESNKTVWFISTHLYAGESVSNELDRLNQVKMIMSNLNKLDSSDAYVLGGDLNSDPNYPHYYGGKSHIHSYLEQIDWENSSGVKPTYFGWNRLSFDYLYSKGLETNGVIIDNLTKAGPNKQQGSDHTPVSCIFNFNVIDSDSSSVISFEEINEELNKDNCDLSNFKESAIFYGSQCENCGKSKEEHTDDNINNMDTIDNMDNMDKIDTMDKMDNRKSITLKDLDNKEVILKLNNSYNSVYSVFKNPIWFGSLGRFSKKQEHAMPIIIISSNDWEYIAGSNCDNNGVHSGAFGPSHKLDCDNIEISCCYISGEKLNDNLRWKVFWKFPWDLNMLQGYLPTYNIPLPVGNYGLWSDNWEGAPKITNKDCSLYNKSVMKYRVDISSGGDVHRLTYHTNNKIESLAMMSSTMFINGYSGVSQKQIKNIVNMLNELKEEGILAFSCYNQHHAIVFCRDTKSDLMISPKVITNIMKDSVRWTRISKIFEKYVNHSVFSNWCKVYKSVFGN
jgi:hypothetical protein